ncbi:MAG: hypothetical protein KJ600_01730 [Nanoarchaeota archaeon]|nr:hypothetical protein [Nanoarchaeota archaeon]MBU1103259.1 hypothetical protein [Nanoarchaeota archaeon]
MRKEAKAALLQVIFLVVIMFAYLVSATEPQWNQSISFPLDIGDFVEDQLPIFTYNVSANVSDADGDTLTFSFSTGDESNPIWSSLHGSQPTSFFTWISLNYTTGILEINSSIDNQTGEFNLSIDVSDSSQSAGARIFFIIGNATNDAPIFVSLVNQSFNRSELFEYVINITDEENNVPFTYNITFLNCSVAEWSTRNCSNITGKELFNSSQYTTNTTAGWINISFTPTRNDVGDYVIMFNVTDLNNNVTPYNATTSRIINFTVLNVNEDPYFTYVCDNERNTTENTPFICYINATDIDETNNLTFTANYTWFTFNSTGTNWTQITTNSASNYNATAVVNFTPTDAAVGNWSVSINLTDTGTPQGSNLTTFYFFIDNVNDSLSLAFVPNKTTYTSEISAVIQINATDDDLLIPDKRVYNESLNFTTNNSGFSVINVVQVPGTNRTNATISFNPSALGAGNHSVNLSVRDANNFSQASQVFTVQVITNNAPVWNISLQTEYALTEDVEFYLNLTQNVTDADGDSLTFSSTINGGDTFPSFSINITTGVINITPVDADVGDFNITITATDGKTAVSKEFNFTVYNVNDAPSIIIPPISLINVTSNSDFTQVNVSEDNYTKIIFRIDDEDYKINSTKRAGFYNEDLTLNLTIQGPNTTLFSFTDPGEVPGHPDGNVTQSTTIFTPRKADVGNYNITINVTDASNASTVHNFNLTVLETQHSPVMTAIGNQVVSILNETLYIDVNATDLEDGSDGPESNLTFKITNLTALSGILTNSYPINSTTGEMNFTFNQTFAGVLQFNVSVNDTEGRTDSEVFNITVYDYPLILLPASSYAYNLQENVSTQLNFTVNHTVQDNLNYTLLVNGIVRNSTTANGNGTEFLWTFMPNFTDETTCSRTINLTLNVSNEKLSNSTTWNLTINHTNYPLSFDTTILSQSGASPLTLTLSNYFTDIDASDSCVNQTIVFTENLVANSTSGGAIIVTITDWINTTIPLAVFSATSAGSANYSLTGTEYNHSNSSQSISTTQSNNFSMALTVSSTTTTTPQSSGGGGSSATKIISLKIIVPEPVSAKQKDRLVIPLKLINDGTEDLYQILLSAVIAKDGLLRNDLVASFDKSSFSSLKVDESEAVILIVDIDTRATGMFEVTINATVENPEYSDWAKLYIEIEEEFDLVERILFIEEFIIGNPQCAEFVDLIEEAKILLSQGRLEEASQKTESALEACKQAISQPPRPRIFEKIGETFFSYAAIGSLAAFALGFVYYYYKKIRLKRQLMGY